MGLLPSVGAPTPSPGNYANPGSPTKILGKVVERGDQMRGMVIDLPVLVIATSVLYNMAFIEDDESNSWGVGDLLTIVAASLFIAHTGIAARWKGVF